MWGRGWGRGWEEGGDSLLPVGKEIREMFTVCRRARSGVPTPGARTWCRQPRKGAARAGGGGGASPRAPPPSRVGGAGKAGRGDDPLGRLFQADYSVIIARFTKGAHQLLKWRLVQLTLHGKFAKGLPRCLVLLHFHGVWLHVWWRFMSHWARRYHRDSLQSKNNIITNVHTCDNLLIV